MTKYVLTPYISITLCELKFNSVQRIKYHQHFIVFHTYTIADVHNTYLVCTYTNQNIIDWFFHQIFLFNFSDATSTGDAVALQNRLQNLNTGLESGLQDLTQYNGLPVPGSHRFISGQQNNYQNGKITN